LQPCALAIERFADRRRRTWLAERLSYLESPVNRLWSAERRPIQCCVHQLLIWPEPTPILTRPSISVDPQSSWIICSSQRVQERRLEVNMSPVITQDMSSSLLSSLLSLQPRLVTFVVVIWVTLNVGQVTAWSGQGCCELTQDARCRRVCLRVRYDHYQSINQSILFCPCHAGQSLITGGCTCMIQARWRQSVKRACQQQVQVTLFHCLDRLAGLSLGIIHRIVSVVVSMRWLNNHGQ